MSFATLLFLASIVARALALVWRGPYARVVRKGTLEREHLTCLLRRLHASGRIGAKGDPFLDTMQRLAMAVCAVARFDGPCPVEKRDRATAWEIVTTALASWFTAPAPAAHDSS